MCKAKGDYCTTLSTSRRQRNDHHPKGHQDDHTICIGSDVHEGWHDLPWERWKRDHATLGAPRARRRLPRKTNCAPRQQRASVEPLSSQSNTEGAADLLFERGASLRTAGSEEEGVGDRCCGLLGSPDHRWTHYCTTTTTSCTTCSKTSAGGPLCWETELDCDDYSLSVAVGSSRYEARTSWSALPSSPVSPLRTYSACRETEASCFRNIQQPCTRELYA